MSDHYILLATQKQREGLIAERDALRGIVRQLVEESERVILAEQQATGRTYSGLQWAVDQAHQAGAV